VSLGRRWYYMLPVAAPLAILMAATAIEIGRSLLRSSRGGTWRSLAVLHIVALAAAVGWVQWSAPVLAPPASACWLMIAAAVLEIVIVLRAHPDDADIDVRAGLAAPMVIGAIFFVAMASRGSLWEIERFETRRFAEEVSQHVPHDQPLLG